MLHRVASLAVFPIKTWANWCAKKNCTIFPNWYYCFSTSYHQISNTWLPCTLSNCQHNKASSSPCNWFLMFFVWGSWHWNIIAKKSIESLEHGNACCITCWSRRLFRRKNNWVCLKICVGVARSTKHVQVVRERRENIFWHSCDIPKSMIKMFYIL